MPFARGKRPCGFGQTQCPHCGSNFSSKRLANNCVTAIDALSHCVCIPSQVDRIVTEPFIAALQYETDSDTSILDLARERNLEGISLEADIDESEDHVSSDEDYISSDDDTRTSASMDESDAGRSESKDTLSKTSNESYESDTMSWASDEHGDEDNSFSQVELLRSCANCRRSQALEIQMPCVMDLSTYTAADVRTRLGWSCLCVMDIRQVDEIMLCKECASFLIRGQQQNKANIWPAFIWKMLTSTSLFADHGVYIWSFVPDIWRHWWIDNISELNGVLEEYSNVTLSTPPSIFRDVTFERNAMKTSIRDLRLADLVNTMNNYMFSTVRCPWGCTEYYHKAQTFDLPSIYLHFLGSKLKVPTGTTDIYVGSAREDFVDSIDFLLMNPKWPITPCVVFDTDTCPYVLVCRDHAKGSKYDYIHPPRSPNGVLPCRYSDQNAHAVVVPRTISPMKAKAYSTTFQMHEMRGSFLGLDTMSLSDYGRHDFISVIAKNDEVMSYCGRSDIRGLVRRHAATGVIPPWLAGHYETDAAIERELNFSRDGDVLPLSPFGKCLKGSTFVSYVDSIQLQQSMDSVDIDNTVIFDDARVLDDRQFQQDDTVRAVPIKPLWQNHVVWTHQLDSHGAHFPRIPRYIVSEVDTRYLWLVVSMLSSIPSFWKATVESVTRTSQWQGWVLARAVKDCFFTRRSKDSRSNPFRLKTTVKKANAIIAGAHLENFNREQLLAQLALVQNVAVVWSTDILQNNNRNTVLPEKQTIIVVRHEDDDEDLRLPQKLQSNDSSSQWELRYVATTDDRPPRAHKWKGSCFVRHGGRQFPRWWMQTRGSRGAIKLGANQPSEDDLRSWTVAAFVQEQLPDFERLRDAYLGYIGGQPNNYCHVHDKPLIAAVNRKGHRTRCTCNIVDESTQCKKTGYLCCAESGCSVTVCRTHAVPVTGMKTHFHPYICSEGNSSSSSVNAGEDIALVGNVAREEEPESVFVDTYSENDGTESENDSLSGSEGGSECHIFSQPSVNADTECTQAFVVDDEIDPGELGDSARNGEGQDEYSFFCTNAARTATPIWCAKTYVSGYVLLNNVGACLIRRDRPIRPRRFQASFLEKMVCTSEGHSVPLVYVEGTMFPSIFWKDTYDGSLVGAMPSALLNDARECNRHGYASVTDHIRSRIKNLSLRTSSDPRYIFHAFDCFANINLRGEDSRIVLSRGFVENETKGGVRPNRSEYFNTDSIDSRPVVNKLSAAVAEETPTYFYTQSCNQKEFYGICELKRWIDSPELKERLLLTHPRLSKDQQLELLDAVTQASCVPVVRNWMEIAEIHMLYVSKSPERPLGRVTKIWWRHEYQGEKGNLSHIHCLLWTDDTDENTILDRIRGSVSELIRPDEIEPLLNEGYFSNVEHINEIRDYGRRFLFHHCDQRCLRRTGPGDNDFKCRVPAAILLNPTHTQHSRVTIEPHHTAAALDVLKEVHLCHQDSTTGHFMPLDRRFVNERCYPCAMPGEGIMSPTNGRIFAYTLSQSNIQRTTGYFSSRYLAKYVAGIDEGNKVYVAPGNDQARGDQQITPELVLHTELYHAPKVTGSKINIDKRQKKLKQSKYPHGRALALTEALTRVMDYSQVYTNIPFEVLATTAMAERPGYDRVKPGIGDERFMSSSGPADLIPGNHIASVTAREALRLPPWRYLTLSEKMLLLDNLYSPVTVDKTTVFGVRPPELRFVMNQGLYYKWFVRGKSLRGTAGLELQSAAVQVEVVNTQWVDGFNAVIRVRLKALPILIHYANGGGNAPRARREVLALMTALERYCVRPITLPSDQVHRDELMERFVVDEGDTPLPVIVFSNIKPTRPQNFLLHVALSMGEFSNEVELFMNSTDIRSIYRNAKLFDPSDAIVSTKTTIRRYIGEQLVHLPGGTKMFDRLCVSAYSVLYEALVEGNIVLQEMPPVLYTSLQTVTSEQVQGKMSSDRKNLATVTINDFKQDVAHAQLPDAEVIAACSKNQPLDPPLTFAKATVQSQESYDEQQAALSIATDKMNKYLSASTTLVKSFCIVGGPGVGKTALLRLMLLKAMSLGLNVMLTTLMSERAFQLGGIHLHKFLLLPVRDKGTVQRIAELALQAIYKSPEVLAMIMALDVQLIDELGQWPDAYIAISDIIYRRVRNSTAFFGGVLVFASMDWKQLKPIHGLPAMLSPSMITSFNFCRLNQSVRAGGDLNLQRIQQIARLDFSDYTPDNVEEFKNLLRTFCTFVNTWESPLIEQSIIRVFGLHDAVKHAEKVMLTKIKNSNISVVECLAKDEQMSVTAHSDWTSASDTIRRQLDKKCKEPRLLHFYPCALYEMTYNDPIIGFSQSQIAVLREMPTADQVRSFRPVQMLLAPSGCKAMPEGISQPDNLISHGWKPVSIGEVSAARVHTFTHGVRGRRLQYGFRHRIAATVHAVMGSDFNKLITSVSTTNPMYRLWEKEQAVVLLSRTFTARDIIFVGDTEDTVRALATLIQMRTQYTEYISHLLRNLCGETIGDNIVVIRNHLIPFRPIDIQLPQEGSGYCYIIVSLQDMGTTYIGQTMSLVNRLNQHNRGAGSRQTADPNLRPWSLISFVCGFDGDRDLMRRFENNWQRRRQNMLISGSITSPQQIADIARMVMTDWSQQGIANDLRYVVAGTFAIN